MATALSSIEDELKDALLKLEEDFQNKFQSTIKSGLSNLEKEFRTRNDSKESYLDKNHKKIHLLVSEIRKGT